MFGSDVVLIGVGSDHVTLGEREIFQIAVILQQFILTISSHEEQLSYDFEL